MKIKKIKNKKAFLLGEVSVKLVIAILAILILIILGVKLFGMFSKENDVKKAEDNLKLIENKIAYLNSPEYTEDFLYVTIFPPKETGWFIKSYGQGYFPSKQCNTKDFKSCLCMCDSPGCKGLMGCIGVEQEVVVESEYLGFVAGGAGTAAGGGTITYEGVLKLKFSTQELKINKENSLIKDEIIIKIKESDRQ